jgi:hypothetical protein
MWLLTKLILYHCNPLAVVLIENVVYKGGLPCMHDGQQRSGFSPAVMPGSSVLHSGSSSCWQQLYSLQPETQLLLPWMQAIIAPATTNKCQSYRSRESR